MKKFIAMLLVVALTCSNFIGFGGSDTVYASQNSSGLNEVETTVISATDVSAGNTKICGQGTVTDVYVNPLYEDCVEVQDVQYAARDYASSIISEPEYVADLNVIVEEIREAMLARENTVTIYYEQMGELGQDFLKGWLDLVMAETDNPKAGDYLERHYSSVRANGQHIKYESGLCEYTLTISFSYYTTAEQEAELDERVAEVLTKIGVSNELTDYEKVKKIYDYICGNITYDYDNLNDKSYTLKYTAYAALINKTAVCQGYASLFYYMARLSDLNVRTIRGNADNGVSIGRHGWNIVKLGDWYYYLDSTWDAGTTKYSYFLKGSDNFTDHMSDDEYKTTEFTSKYSISEKDYVPPTIIESGNCGSNGGENVTYTLDSEGTLIISGTGGIAGSAFKNRTDLKKLIIEEGITYIHPGAFYGCSGLEGELKIPSSVYSIGRAPDTTCGGAFEGCSGFTGELVLPEGLTGIGDYAFAGCSGFTGDLRIPETVTAVDFGAFKGCSGFDGELVLPSNVTSIRARSFAGCSGLTGDIIIPEGVYGIYPNAFADCSGFNGELIIPDSVEIISEYAFYNCSGLTGDLVVPGSVKKISSGAFKGCGGRDLIISEGITAISNGFSGCNGFTGELKLPNSLTSITNRAFAGCSGFTGDLVIPKNVTNIEQGSFVGFNGRDLIISDGITTIKSGWFKNCSGFTGNLIIPDSVTTIESEAFYGCSGFTGNLVIPDSVTTIGENAFYYCSGFDGELKLPKALTSLKDRVFCGCSGLTGELIIPDSVTYIGDYIFSFCSGFTGTLQIPSGVTTIGNWAFSECSGFTGGLEIPESVTDIGVHAFYNCTGLESVVIPESIKVIRYGTFARCTNLKSARIPKSVTSIETQEYPEEYTSVLGDAFAKCDKLVIYLNSAYVKDYAKTHGIDYIVLSDALEIKSMPDKTEYCLNEVFNSSGLVLMAKYYDGTSEDVTSSCVINGFDSTRAGVRTISATYNGHTVTFNVNINASHSYKNKWSMNAEKHWQECFVCGEVKDEAKHTFDNACDTNCNTCGYIRIIKHDFEEKWTTNEHYHWHKCSVCSEKNGYDIHDVGEWSTVILPSYTKEGLKERKCAECGYTESAAIDTYVATSIVLNENYIELLIGKNMILTTICAPVMASAEDVVWTSSNSQVAKIDKNGKVIAVGVGSAIITATVGTVSASCTVVVIGGQWMHDGVGWWYRNTDGTYPANSWKDIDSARYYFNGFGYMVTGWQLIGGTWYYFSGSGAMATGWQSIGGTWYYFNGNGAMVTGWQLIGGIWYYLSGSGAMVTGWQAIGGTWYYFHGSGAMATGWQLIGGTWYYFVGSGAMVTGWQEIGNIWYYFQGSGAMAASQWVGNYYLQADGSMAVNKRIGVYYVGADGAWIPGV